MSAKNPSLKELTSLGCQLKTAGILSHFEKEITLFSDSKVMMIIHHDPIDVFSSQIDENLKCELIWILDYIIFDPRATWNKPRAGFRAVWSLEQIHGTDKKFWRAIRCDVSNKGVT